MTKYSKRQKYITLSIITVTLFLIDFLTKKWAYDSLRGNQQVDIISGVFRLRFVWNPGSAFGIFTFNNWGFLIINILISSIFIYYFFFRQKNFIYQIISLVIIVGGMGNVIDRFIYRGTHSNGAVVDFISFLNFPVFNFADIYVVVGIFTLVIMLWREDSAKKKIPNKK